MLFITGYAENAVLGNGYLRPGMQVLTKLRSRAGSRVPRHDQDGTGRS